MLRLPNYSLKRGIIMHLALLILSAMLLINFIMIKFAERDLLKAKVAIGRMVLQALVQRVEGTTGAKGQSGLKAIPETDVSVFLEAGGLSSALMVDREGKTVFRMGRLQDDSEATSNARQALAGQDWHVALTGRAWGVAWFAHERLHMAAPVFYQGRPTGAISVCAELTPLYRDLRRSQGIILMYALINTMVLVMVGMYLLSRTVVRPVHRLLDIIEQFPGEAPVPPLPEAPRNEIGRLFRSFNAMLKRLEKNKADLKDTIASLEQANRALQNAQDEMAKSEKLASVGRLATGVAHEIGNPLSIVLGFIELLKNEEVSAERRKDFLDRAEYEISRIGETIRRLLDFAKSGGGECRPIHVHDMLHETLAMLRPHLMKAQILVNTRFGAADDRVRTDPDPFKQVILNVTMNGVDAMSSANADTAETGGGVLTIKTRNQDQRLEISFEDTGAGIPREELIHIFDPFYTTKEPGMGSGLGLSVCYRIIDDLGGRIRVESTLGEGTTVIIDIPLDGAENPG